MPPFHDARQTNAIATVVLTVSLTLPTMTQFLLRARIAKTGAKG